MGKRHVADGETQCADTQKLSASLESLLRFVKPCPAPMYVQA